MITDQDVEKLKETFVTKTEHQDLVRRVDGIQEQLGDLKVEVGELHDKVDALEVKVTQKFDVLEVKFDAMLGLLTDSMEEHRSGAAHFARHDRQIAALGVATGTVLPD
jgi:hypothetical protein